MALQEGLLLFVVDALCVKQARGQLTGKESRDNLAKHILPCLLAVRRLTFYLASKFKYQDLQMHSEFRNPAKAFMQIFCDFGTFHRCFPKGVALPGEEPAEHLQWIDKLPLSLQLLIESVANIFDGKADGIIRTAIAGDQYLAAEAILSRSDMASQGIFELAKITSEYNDEIAKQAAAALKILQPELTRSPAPLQEPVVCVAADELEELAPAMDEEQEGKLSNV